MYYSNRYECDQCGDIRELSTDKDDGGCCSCGGTYRKVGASYDQEGIEQRGYERQLYEENEQRYKFY